MNTQQQKIHEVSESGANSNVLNNNVELRTNYKIFSLSSIQKPVLPMWNFEKAAEKSKIQKCNQKKNSNAE